MTTPNNTVAGLAEKWRKKIEQYDSEHIGSSDPEDWMAGHRECLAELEAALASPAPSAPVVDDAMEKRATQWLHDNRPEAEKRLWASDVRAMLNAALSGVSANVGVEGYTPASADSFDSHHNTATTSEDNATPAAAPKVECVACEGKPAPENNPCAVCATPATSDEGEQA